MESFSQRLPGGQARLYVLLTALIALVGLSAWRYLPHHWILFGVMGGAAALACIVILAFPKHGLYAGVFYVYAGLFFYTSAPIPALITLIATIAVALRLMRSEAIMVRDPLFLWPLAIFTMFILQSMLFAHDHWYSLVSFSSFLKSILLIFLLAQLVRTEKDLSTLALVVFAATLASVVLGVMNNAMGIVHEEQSVIPGAAWQRFSATHLNANRAAHFFVAGLPLGIYAVKRARSHIGKIFLIGGVVVLVVATVLTFSRQTIFPLTLVLLAVLFREARSRWAYALVAAAVAIGLFFVPPMYWHRINTISSVFDEAGEDWSLAMRVQAFKSAWRMFLDHPFTGVGLNNFIVRSDLIVKIGAHNGYLEVLTSVGIFGFIAFLLMPVAGMRGYLRAIKARWPADRAWMTDLSYYSLLSMFAVLVSLFFEQAQFHREVWLPIAAGLITGRLVREAGLAEKKAET